MTLFRGGWKRGKSVVELKILPRHDERVRRRKEEEGGEEGARYTESGSVPEVYPANGMS